MGNEKADSALNAIPTPGKGQREPWATVCMAYKAAGGDYETFDRWSARAQDGSYSAAAARQVWDSITPGGGITEATLYGEAIKYGWTDPTRTERRENSRKATGRAAIPPPKPEATPSTAATNRPPNASAPSTTIRS